MKLSHTVLVAYYIMSSIVVFEMFYSGDTEIGSIFHVYYSHAKNQLPLKLGQSRPKEPSEVCEIPAEGFKAWNKKFVSAVTPEVPINCSKIFSHDKTEISSVKESLATWKSNLSDEDIMIKVNNCSLLRDFFNDNFYNSKLEKQFPIAFTFVVYDSPEQVLRLLRLLYRPQNTYCIHPDVKSPYRTLFESIADCFDNIIIPSRLENVVWGYYTIMAAQMNCLEDLLSHRHSNVHKWKYVINLCGKELPLVTNREIVSRLQNLNGSSSILTQPCENNYRFIQRIRYPAKLNPEKTHMWMDRSVRLKDRPFDISLYHKSSSYNAISHQFGNFLVNNSTSKKIYNYFKKCANSEEHYYATLYMMPGVPGGFDKNIPRENYFGVAGYRMANKKKLNSFKCGGKVVHYVCIVSVADLADVAKTKNRLFFNKYFMSLDHAVMNCMEEKMIEQNKLEYLEECGAGHA